MSTKLIKEIKRLLKNRAPFSGTLPEAVFRQAVADEQNQMKTHHQLDDDAAEDLIASYVNAQWDAWVSAGGLDAVEQVLGPVKEEPAHSIFQAGWKLAAAHCMQSGRAIAIELDQMK